MKEEGNSSELKEPVEELREERVEWIDIGPSKRTTYRTTIIVLLLSILLHAGLFYAMPKRIFPATPVKISDKQKQKQNERVIRLRLVPPQPKAPEPDRYVQATDAPENVPDETNNFSSKNQQASQIIESKDKTGKTPEPEKGEEENANALQTGQNKTQPGQQATVAQIVRASKNDTDNEEPLDEQKKQDPKAEIGESAPQAEEEAPPLPVAIEDAHPNPQNSGKGIAEVAHAGKDKKMPDKAPKEREIPAVVVNPLVRMEQPKVDPTTPSGMKPRPRPRLNLQGPMPTVIKKTLNGLATPTGNIAFNTKLSEFGDYISRMMEVISTKWYDLNASSAQVISDSDTYVLIKFYVNKTGQIEDLTILETNSSQSAQWRCTDAILSNAPYFEWTKDMVVILGDRQPVLIHFKYR